MLHNSWRRQPVMNLNRSSCGFRCRSLAEHVRGGVGPRRPWSRRRGRRCGQTSPHQRREPLLFCHSDWGSDVQSHAGGGAEKTGWVWSGFRVCDLWDVFSCRAWEFVSKLCHLRLKLIKLLFFPFTVREKIGAIATPDYIQNAPGLPKTRSGKVITLLECNWVHLLMFCTSVHCFHLSVSIFCSMKLHLWLFPPTDATVLLHKR